MNKFDIFSERIIKEMAFGLGGGTRGVSTSTPKSQDEIMSMIVEIDNKRKKTPISFTAITEPKHRKKGFPYAKLYKATQTVAEINFNYEQERNRELEKRGEEANFQAQQNRNIKERISQSVGITTRDLPVLILNSIWIKPAASVWVVKENDGSLKKVEKEDLVDFLPPPSPTGTDVKYRTYGFDKIVGISVAGGEYINTDVDPEKTEVFEFVKGDLKS